MLVTYTRPTVRYYAPVRRARRVAAPAVFGSVSAFDRFGPFTAFDRAFAEIARAFEHPATTATSPRVSGQRTDAGYVVTAALPGFTKEQVSASVAGRTLTIEAVNDTATWKKSFALGAAFDIDKVEASFADETLTVEIANVPAPEARSIEIADAAPAVLDAAPEVERSDAPASSAADAAATKPKRTRKPKAD